MEKEYLVTFKSTTAALRAKMLLEDSLLEACIIDSAEIIPIPYALSGTCFGFGLRCKASEQGIHDLYDFMKTHSIDYKNFWVTGKEYTACTDILEKGA